MMRVGERQQACKRREHADGQRIGLRSPVGVAADKRLEKRRRDLENESNDADLGKAQRIIVFEDRIDRRQQRLDHVIQHVAEAECEKNGKNEVLVARSARCILGQAGHRRLFPCRESSLARRSDHLIHWPSNDRLPKIIAKWTNAVSIRRIISILPRR